MKRRSLWRRLRRATRGPRNRLLAGVFVGFGRLLGLLPLRAGVALGRFLGGLAHGGLATPRRLAREHVAIAFPDLDATACARVVRETFRHAGASFAELTLFDKILHRGEYLRLEGAAALEAGLALGRGVIAATGHCGNWELLAAWGAAIGWPITVVVRRVTDLRFHALIVRFRTAAGVEVLVRDDPNFVRAVSDALRRNRIVAMLIDQDTRGAGVFVPFFGRPARTPPGAAVLALRGRVPVVTVFIERRPEGGHLIRVTPVPLDVPRGHVGVERLTARLTAAIEAQIRRAPAEWVWWHQRWRRQPERRRRVVATGGVQG
jgi:Kdo2-lipid IVA lauroyltransferase/acyltransferase